MRITTSAIMRNYKSNLANSISNLDDIRNHVLTGRKFNSVAENPSAALRASVLERKYLSNEDYLATAGDAQKRQDMQDSAIQSLSKLFQEAKGVVLEGANLAAKSSEQRKVLATSLRQMQESMVSTLNSTYGDNYIFAGSDGKNPPFTFDVDTNTLKYRGYDVDDMTNITDLTALAQEKTYVDLGFGMSFNPDGSVVPSSAFNTSVPGISIVGYGSNADGLPKNIVTIAGELASALEAEPVDSDKLDKLASQFESSYNGMLSTVAEVGVRSQFLDTTINRLEDNALSIAEQIDNVVNEDPAESLTNYAWAQYAYSAALKVGVNILSPSLIDFMK